MVELVFILTDYFSAAGADEQRSAENSHGDADSGAGLPRLPLLETIFARARIEAVEPDWRGWLAARVPGAASASMAQTVAAAWDAPQATLRPAGEVWLASPVHYFAGLDSIYLHRAGLLRLDAAEQDLLVADFARVFAGSAWSLRSIGRRELLLSGPMLAAGGADPAQFAGCDPSAGMPRGPGAAELRGLGAEMEMWLYEHPLNLERRSRGELPVTTLWLWGAQHNAGQLAAAGASPRTQLQARALPPLFGSDSYAEALWRLGGAESQALPAGFDAVAAGVGGGAIILYPLQRPEGLSAAALQLEQRWLPGALQLLRRRRIRVLRLVAGTRAYALHWLDLARVWRRRTPWWETLA